MRESSKRLSKRYKFKRTLATQPSIVSLFRERDSRINRVPPVKDAHIWEPMDMPAYTPGTSVDEIMVERPPSIRISRDKPNWPFRVEFIEQLLDINKVWVVVAIDWNTKTQYSNGNGGAISQNVGGMELDIVAIDKPRIMIKGPLHNKRPVLHEKELYDIEKGTHQTAMVYGSEIINVEGKSEQAIDINLCNILPHSLTMYNCAFYHHEVAHLYLESLAEHIKRFVVTDRWQS